MSVVDAAVAVVVVADCHATNKRLHIHHLSEVHCATHVLDRVLTIYQQNYDGDRASQ